MALPASGVALSVATGALTLVDPSSLGPGAHRLHRAAMAGLVGWTTYDALCGETSGIRVSPPVGAGLSVAAGTAALAAGEPSERGDAALHRWLTSRGVRHPRRATALASALLTLAIVVIDQRLARQRDASG